MSSRSITARPALGSSLPGYLTWAFCRLAGSPRFGALGASLRLSGSPPALASGTSPMAIVDHSLASCAGALGLLDSAMVLLPCERVLRGGGAIALDIVYVRSRDSANQVGSTVSQYAICTCIIKD